MVPGAVGVQVAPGGSEVKGFLIARAPGRAAPRRPARESDTRPEQDSTRFVHVAPQHVMDGKLASGRAEAHLGVNKKQEASFQNGWVKRGPTWKDNNREQI